MTDDMPTFLRRAPGSGHKIRPLRWTKVVVRRPEGETWKNATRWEVSLGRVAEALIPSMPCGTRRVWVVVGHKWVHIYDPDHNNVHIRVSLWHVMVKEGSARKLP